MRHRWTKQKATQPWETGVRDHHSDESWTRLLRRSAIALMLCDTEHGIRVQWEADTTYTLGPKHGHDPAQLDAKCIRFNGIDDDGAETFMLTRGGSHDYQGSWHCETNGKPYELAVRAVLLIARDEIGLHVEPDPDTWTAAQAVADKTKKQQPKVAKI